MWINGAWGGRIDIDGTLDTVVSIAIEDGRISHIFAIRNPHKLAHLDGVSALTRA
jgi:RNA polymerase sigma-70 factor (ECF subfamily)